MFTEWKKTGPGSGLKHSGELEKGQTMVNLELMKEQDVENRER
jgi:hypothetical protein